MKDALLWAGGAGLLSSPLIVLTTWLLARKKHREDGRNRSADRSEANTIRQNAEWNERHRSALKKTQGLVDRTVSVAHYCEAKPRSRRDLRRWHVPALLHEWEMLERKMRLWDFKPESQRKIKRELKSIYSYNVGPLTRLSGAKSMSGNLQSKSAERILELQCPAKIEAEKQYYKSTEPEPEPRRRWFGGPRRTRRSDG